MMRWMGVILVLAGCAGVGFYTGNQLVQRLDQLMELVKISEFLKGEISFSRSTLPEALGRIGTKSKKPFQEFLENLSVDMKKYSGEAFADLLEQEMNLYLSDSALHKSDLQEFYLTYKNLGYLDKEMQVHLLERYIKEREKEIDRMYQKLPAQKKLFHSLGVLGGLFLSIILI